ncbi:hypothetical protein RYX36_027512, partial [Vicia faba]
MADCPLDFTASNFMLESSLCSDQGRKGEFCRHINANIVIYVAHFANATRKLGVPLNISIICLYTISHALQHYGVPQLATNLCGFRTKNCVNYECKGRNSAMQMLKSPRYMDVTKHFKVPLGRESNCK